MVTRDKKLRIPRFVRMRPDRKPEECTTDQLKEVRIAVITGDPDTEQADYPEKGGSVSRKGRSQKTGPSREDRSHEVPEEPALEEYTRKRDFSVTGEPEGKGDSAGHRELFCRSMNIMHGGSISTSGWSGTGF